MDAPYGPVDSGGEHVDMPTPSKILTFTLCVLALLISQVASAEPPKVESIPPGDDVIVPLRKGDTAPFTGQLYSQDTALRWVNWIVQYRRRLELDVKREKDLRLVEVEHYSKLLKLERSRSEEMESSLRLRLKSSEDKREELQKRLNDPPWYQSVEFGVVLGILSTVGVLSLSIWALEARS